MVRVSVSSTCMQRHRKWFFPTPLTAAFHIGRPMDYLTLTLSITLTLTFQNLVNSFLVYNLPIP